MDDCLAGPRYRHIIDTIVLDFILPDIINIRWDKKSILLLIHILDYEFNYMYIDLHEGYKPVFIYNELPYNYISEKLISDLTKNGFTGVIKLNLPLVDERSQLLLFKKLSGDVNDDWLDTYCSIANNFLKNN